MPIVQSGKLENERGFNTEPSQRQEESNVKKVLIRRGKSQNDDYATSLIRAHKFDKSNPYVHTIIPYDVRLNNYYKIRKQIFDTNNKPSPTSSRSSVRLRKFWKTIKNNRKIVNHLVCSIKHKSCDLRPYAKIKILDSEYLGLLDSGAQVSCLGSSLAEDICKRKQICKHTTSVCTADGKEQVVFGTVDLNVVFENKNHKIKFFVVPSVSQEVILGVDFWSKFKIAPHVISEICLETRREENTLCLSNEQQRQLDVVKNRFPSFEKEGLGKTSLMEYVIELQPGVRPIKQRYFPISPAVEKLVHAEIDEMLKLGVIEESPNSPWSSPIVLVKKPNKVRLCLDSRKVNSVTIKDAYPLPHIDGILSRIPKAKYISSLDLRRAFWQIPLSDSSRDFTCFTVPNRPLYRYCVMPFGLCNAPQALCRLMDRVIPPQLKNQVFVYLDDLLIVSEDFDIHMSVLSEVAYHLRKAGLTINIEKSKFCIKEVKYLGYIVGDGTLKTDPDKISAVTNYPVPTNVKLLRRFLGMAGWYRRFIDNFAAITSPLSNLLKKGKNFSWNEEAQKSFDQLKQMLCSAPVLASPNYEKPFTIQCDASKLGVGAVLSQNNDEDVEVPIAYFSQKLSKAQSNYSVTELECLAAILSLKKFRAYVEGQDFTIVTDHASLQWLMRQTDLSSRLARWSLKLQGYRFKIEHRKGSLNVVPDSLSRQNFEEINKLEVHPLVNLNSSDFLADEYKNLINNIRNNESRLPDLQIIDGHVYKRTEHPDGNPAREAFNWKLWIPKTLARQAIEHAHCPPNKCHGGIAKTLERLRLNLYWPNMTVDVKEFVGQCDICQQSKAPNVTLRPPMSVQYTVQRPFQKLYIDLLGPYPRSRQGNTGILIVLDDLTKFPLLKAIRSFNTSIICNFLKEHVFSIFGSPEIILSDNGKQFKASQFNNLLAERGIRHIYTALYSPQANTSERINRSIIAGIRSYLKDDHTHWDKNLPEITESLRSSIHQSIGCTPYFALFGQQMLAHASEYVLIRKLEALDENVVDRTDRLKLIRKSVVENIKKAFDNSAKRYNLRSTFRNFKIGDTVYRRNFTMSDASKKLCAKFSPKFIKAKVIGVKGNCMYELSDEVSGKRGIYHGKDIRANKH